MVGPHQTAVRGEVSDSGAASRRRPGGCGGAAGQAGARCPGLLTGASALGSSGPRPRPTGGPGAPTELWAPAHRAVAFETHQGIPALDGKGLQAGRRFGTAAPRRQRPLKASGTLPRGSQSPARRGGGVVAGVRWGQRAGAGHSGTVSAGGRLSGPEKETRGAGGASKAGLSRAGALGRPREIPMAGSQPPVPRTVPGPQPRTPQA